MRDIRKQEHDFFGGQSSVSNDGAVYETPFLPGKTLKVRAIWERGRIMLEKITMRLCYTCRLQSRTGREWLISSIDHFPQSVERCWFTQPSTFSAFVWH